MKKIIISLAVLGLTTLSAGVLKAGNIYYLQNGGYAVKYNVVYAPIKNTNVNEVKSAQSDILIDDQQDMNADRKIVVTSATKNFQ